VYSAGDLVRLLRQEGSEVEIFSRDQAGLRKAIAARPDVLVVSGGDGTVAKAAIALRASAIPMYILPTGTSNNIARSVGVDGAIPPLVRRLTGEIRHARLDVGRIAEHGREAFFVEAAGAGFIGALLHEEERPLLRRWRRFRRWAASPFFRGDRPLRGVARIVRQMRARQVSLRADGDDLSGDYVSVEVMNIAAIGPRIVLAPKANPGDRLLDVVLVRERDREALADYIDADASTDGGPPVETRRARCIEMEWPAHNTHLDDNPWRGARDWRPGHVSIDIGGTAPLLIPGAR
jgi:diacylglycerol kinase family enzyme